MDGVPGVLGVVPLGVEVLDGHALLLDPGVILEVVDALALRIGQLEHVVGLEAEHMQVVIQFRRLRGVRAVLLVELIDTGLVHDGRVGQNGDDDVVLGQLVELRHLDAAKDIGDAGNAHPGELFKLLVGDAEGLEVLLAFLAVEEAKQSLGIFVVDVDDHVGVLDIVDPGDVLVADALDAVAAEAVVEDGRALERFADGELHGGVALLQKVARGHRAGGAGGEAGACQSLAGLLDGFKEVCKGVAGDVVMPQGVAHLGELVEDHHAGVFFQLPRLVEDLLDIGLAAGGGDDLAGDGLEPVKALLGHVLRQNRDGVACQQLGVERAAAAVVAGGGPYGMMVGGVELTGHEARGQAAEARADLVAAGGEPLAGHGEDAAFHAGNGGGDLHVVRDLLEQAAGLLGLIVPADAEQVDGIDIPQTRVRQLFLDLPGDEVRVLHLGDGRDDDVVFLGLLDVVRKAFLVDGQIDFTHVLFLLLFYHCLNKNTVCTWIFQSAWRSCRRIS